MKTFRKSDDLFFAVVKRSKFQGILICLGTTVAQKKLVIFLSTYVTELISKLLLQWNFYRVGVKSNLVQLVFDTLHPMRMCMTYRNDRMTAVHVEVACALIVPHIRTFAFYNGNVVDWVNVKQFHFLYSSLAILADSLMPLIMAEL